MDVRVLELVPVHDSQRPGPARIMGAVVMVIEVVVEDDHGPVIPAQRTPADIIIPRVPVDPGGSPVGLRNPVPAQAQSPVPAAVVVSAPAPGLIGNPVPAAVRVPEPPAVMVQPPVIVIDAGNPDISERPLVSPGAVGSQLVFVVVELRRKVALRQILIVERVPVIVPAVKVIAAISPRPLRAQMPVGSH